MHAVQSQLISDLQNDDGVTNLHIVGGGVWTIHNTYWYLSTAPFSLSDSSPVPLGVTAQSSAEGKAGASLAWEYLRVEGLIQGTRLVVVGVPWDEALEASPLCP